MGSSVQRRILIAPLDWGLGHTTRCIPLMRYLLSLGHMIVFAGNQIQQQYISKTFPGIETIHLDGYGVRYASTAGRLKLALLQQIPRLLTAISREQAWLQQLTTEQHFDGIISDNRYGLFHPSIPAVFITHQLQVQTGFGDLADNWLRQLHYRYIRRFDTCWVVDTPGTPNLAGRLSHPDRLPPQTHYLGLLSQLERPQLSRNTPGKILLVLLSGPEPQRSILSAILWQQCSQYHGTVVFVEGSDSAPERIAGRPGMQWKRYVTRETLQPMLENASLVICRSGYSTLMDLVIMRLKAILIPTPGQTEQEYLGRYLHRLGIFYCASQTDFNLTASLEAADKFPFHSTLPDGCCDRYQPVVAAWIDNIQHSTHR